MAAEQARPEKARWADIVRMKMKTANNPTGAPISLKQLSELCGYSREHLRRTCMHGEPVSSRELSDAVCDALGIDDKGHMWDLALQSKVAAKLGSSILTDLPRDTRLIDLWSRMSEADRTNIITIATGYAVANESMSAPRTAPVRIRKTA